MKANEDVRNHAKIKKVKLWEVANTMNMQDSNFSRKLRHELTATEKKDIFAIIDSIATEKENATD